jgi:hypothetical protein
MVVMTSKDGDTMRRRRSLLTSASDHDANDDDDQSCPFRPHQPTTLYIFLAQHDHRGQAQGSKDLPIAINVLYTNGNKLTRRYGARDAISEGSYINLREVSLEVRDDDDDDDEEEEEEEEGDDKEDRRRGEGGGEGS